MRDATGTVLYVGKARDLRKRVRSYFGTSRDSRWHIRFLMERVADIGCIVTDTEKEALILENTLIKQHRPRYNFNLRDDKTYFSLRMDMNEPFPRLTIVRKVPKDGARYFGPYSSASAAREVLKELYRVFPLRHYPYETCRQRRRPCLFYQIRQCAAPCHGLIGQQEYAALAEGAALFLAGRKSDLIGIYKRKMAEAAAAEQYEQAVRYRDLLRAIEITLEKQNMVASGGDIDVLGMSRSDSSLEIVILHIRGGSLIGSRNYSHVWEMDDAEGAASFLGEYYNGDVFIPEEVLIPFPLSEADALEEFLSEKQGKKVTVSHPRRGRKHELVNLATKNAETRAQEKAKAIAGSEALLHELQEKLHLGRLPKRIECYDISNIQGQLAVGSRASFLNGRPDKSAYRHYRIRTVSQPDDFSMMREVLSRRFGRGDEPPDLLVVDGGIGQLNILREVLKEMNVEGVDAVSLAKSRVEREGAETEIARSDERVFLPGRKNPVVLRQNSAPLLLLAHVRDEAHRFAISYHKKLRGKSAIRSRIEDVAGIGTVRKKALLTHFGSLRNLQGASVDEICGVKGMTRPVAEMLWNALREKQGE